MGIAASTYADITRSQYDDWLNRFYPKQLQLMQYATDGTLMNQQLSRADANQQQALNTATVGAANQAARYGATNDASGNDTSLGLKTALATAGSKNGIRDAQQERELNILTGGSSSLRDMMNIGGK